MWSNKNRNTVIKEFKETLKIFGPEREKHFPSDRLSTPHVVTVFGEGALCTMVNSIPYNDEELGFHKAEQGVDELITTIMELLSPENLLGWCVTVLHRRSFWEKVSQKTNGFVHASLRDLMSIREKSVTEMARDALVIAAKAYLDAR